MKAARSLLALIAAALGLLAADPARAEERILHFLSDVTVARDGTLLVAETIRVNVEGNRIQRGIFRDFPTRYERDGRRVRVGFDVDGVDRDGRPEPWDTESLDNGVRVRIGDADVLLDPGEHVYTLRYRTTRQLGFFEGYDELYWNATGTGWDFPIEVAEARIRLPQAVRFGNRSVYTGPQGSTAAYAEVVEERPGEILFRTTAPLGPQEGLTVAAAWPKGVVEAPPPPSATALWLEEHAPPAAALLALLGLAIFYFYAWRRAGRGPSAGTVVPLFSPPDGLSAAALRYVERMGYDNRAFAAAIVESGVRGKLRLVETESGGLFSGTETRIDKGADGSDMPPPERDMLAALFAGGDSIAVDKANHARFSAAQAALRKGLAKAYGGKLFVANKGWAVAGTVLMLASMLLVGAAALATDPYGRPGSALVALGGGASLIAAIALARRSRITGAGGSCMLALAALLLAGAGLAAIAATFGLIADSGRVTALLALLAPLLALPLGLSAYWWMAAPTREGRAAMDRIAGFEHYLSVAEEDRLETLHPPEKTPELFERYLPHAIALGVENRWAEQFEDVLAAASAAGRSSGMGWYSGRHDPWHNPGRFAGAVGGSLASSVASASTAPGSSSGSGGGGSSGGGGGGGGGGGW